MRVRTSEQPRSWADVSGRSFTMLGVGRGTASAANALLRRGADVRAHDDFDNEAVRRTARRHLDPTIPITFGALPPTRPGEVFVASAGFVTHSANYTALIDGGHAVLDESDVFYGLMTTDLAGGPCRMVGVTGSNGKTTTVEFLSHLLRTAGLDVVVGGNNGVPLCEHLESLTEETVVVAELSEIQLLGQHETCLDIGVITNIAYDHGAYNRAFGGDVEAYDEAKWSLNRRLRPDGTLVLNVDCPKISRLAARDKPAGQRLAISLNRTPSPGWSMDAEHYVHKRGGTNPDVRIERAAVHLSSPSGKAVLVGPHTHSDVLLALAVATTLGVDARVLASGLASLQGPEHRMNMIASPQGPLMVDDAKSSNPPAALAAIATVLSSLPGRRIVWIGGGQRDDASREDLISVLAGAVDSAVLFGESAPNLARALGVKVPTHVAEDLTEATRRAAELAADDGVVLLSPAAKSFDMFNGYAERGRAFRVAVAAMGRMAEGT